MASFIATASCLRASVASTERTFPGASVVDLALDDVCRFTRLPGVVQHRAGLELVDHPVLHAEGIDQHPVLDAELYEVEATEGRGVLICFPPARARSSRSIS